MDNEEKLKWRKHFERKIQIAVDEHYFFTGEKAIGNFEFTDD